MTGTVQQMHGSVEIHPPSDLTFPPHDDDHDDLALTGLGDDPEPRVSDIEYTLLAPDNMPQEDQFLALLNAIPAALIDAGWTPGELAETLATEVWDLYAAIRTAVTLENFASVMRIGAALAGEVPVTRELAWVVADNLIAGVERGIDRLRAAQEEFPGKNIPAAVQAYIYAWAQLLGWAREVSIHGTTAFDDNPELLARFRAALKAVMAINERGEGLGKRNPSWLQAGETLSHRGEVDHMVRAVSAYVQRPQPKAKH